MEEVHFEHTPQPELATTVRVPPAVTVAICVDCPTPFLDRSVAALREQGAEPLVLEGLRPAAVRNAALQACDTDVLAFVDPDVLVSPGWLRGVTAAWATAPADRGAIGGPIGLRFEAGRPRWLGDGLLTALGSFSDGDTLASGNVAFRANALRGAGGFWPARGEPAQRDLFTEAHLVQREMRELGWTQDLRLELTVQRLIGAVQRRDVLRFRTRYGARKQRIGVPREGAGRALATASAGALAAAPKPALAMERAGRAAEALGALAPGRFAHDALQPVEISTPFRPSVPDPQPRRAARVRRATAKDAALVLLYHRVAAPEHDPLGLCVSPENFAAQIDAIRDRVVPLDALEPGGVAITFDDGYADNLHTAAPLLGGLPATFFISTGHVEQGRAFYWDTVERLLRCSKAEGLLEMRSRSWPARTPAERELARRHLHALLQVRPQSDIDLALERVAAWSGAPLIGDDPRPMSIAEVRALAALEGVTIGAHGRTHRSLRWASDEEREDELRGSADDLERWLGARPSAFSYPYGVAGRDVDAACEEAAGRAGYTLAMLNGGGPAQLRQVRNRPLGVARMVPPDAASDGFARWRDALLRP